MIQRGCTPLSPRRLALIAPYAAFVAQAAKMGELHSNLAKAAFKPAELAIANMQGTQ
jgi:hypothetical protein